MDNIEHNWKEFNGTSVHYLIDFDMTIVKFETQFKINEGISEGISEGFGKTSRTVENHLQKLKDAGFIGRKGPKLGGYW